MDIWKPEALLLFLVFFVPGFVIIKVYDMLVAGERRDFSNEVFHVVGLSCVNFAALAWIIVPITTTQFHQDRPVLYFGSLLAVFFLFPAIWPVLFLQAVSWSWVAKRIPHPIAKAWDWVFWTKRRAQWVIVHLRDGRRIGGRYDTSSFASSEPADEQIYLEEVWRLGPRGEFLEPVDRGKGILVLGCDILAVEFFE